MFSNLNLPMLVREGNLLLKHSAPFLAILVMLLLINKLFLHLLTKSRQHYRRKFIGQLI